MNASRLQAGIDLLRSSIERASRAFELAVDSAFKETEGRNEIAFTLFDYVRGISTRAVRYEEKPSQALVRIPISLPDLTTASARLLDADGKGYPAAIRRVEGEQEATDAELVFVTSVDGGERKDFRVDLSARPVGDRRVQKAVSAGKHVLENEFVTLRFDEDMHPVGLTCSGIEMADGLFIRSAINYAGRVAQVSGWTILETSVLGDGLVGLVRVQGEIGFKTSGERQRPGEKRVDIEREFMLASGIPYLYVNTRITYPKTHSDHYDRHRARALEQEYDGNWREVMPCEIRPTLFGRSNRPLRVWKHNYLGHTSAYDLNYGQFSKNEEIDSFNNHVTHAWVAVTSGKEGLLVAQTADANASFAFCPMRTRMTQRGTRILLNPFGSYHGRQWSYATAYSGLGKLLAVKLAESLDPLAPSYNGRTESFSLLIAPYSGDEPPREIRSDAEAFAYPYAVVSRSGMIRQPWHRQWTVPEAR
jgi:hypothetical protein